MMIWFGMSLRWEVLGERRGLGLDGCGRQRSEYWAENACLKDIKFFSKGTVNLNTCNFLIIIENWVYNDNRLWLPTLKLEISNISFTKLCYMK